MSALLEAPAPAQELSAEDQEAQLRELFDGMTETERTQEYDKDINRYVDLDVRTQTPSAIRERQSLDRKLAVLGEFVFSAVSTPDLMDTFKTTRAAADEAAGEEKYKGGKVAERLNREATMKKATVMVLTNVILNRSDLGDLPPVEKVEEAPEEQKFTASGQRIIAEATVSDIKYKF